MNLVESEHSIYFDKSIIAYKFVMDEKCRMHIDIYGKKAGETGREREFLPIESESTRKRVKNVILSRDNIERNLEEILADNSLDGKARSSIIACLKCSKEQYRIETSFRKSGTPIIHVYN